MAETDKGNLTETQRAIYKQAKQQKKKETRSPEVHSRFFTLALLFVAVGRK